MTIVYNSQSSAAIGCRVICGDAEAEVPALQENSIDCVVTSPPYWALREYGGIDNLELGIESTCEQFVERLVTILDSCRKPLKDEGVLWVNLGDKYQDKSLLQIPSRFALGMHEMGWKLRADVIWHKSNPLPESVRDRPCQLYERILMLTRSDKALWNYDVAQEPLKPVSSRDYERKRRVRKKNAKYRGTNYQQTIHVGWRVKKNTRSIGNIWYFATAGSYENHYAAFPVELPWRCISYSCPEGGTVLDPFAGSGTTAIAAWMLDCKSVMIDCYESNCELMYRRFQQLKGKPVPAMPIEAKEPITSMFLMPQNDEYAIDN